MKKDKKSRRQFLRDTGMAIVGAGIFQGEAISARQVNQQVDTPKIRHYRRLGRTEALVSDIGSGEPTSSSVLRYVLDSGVNFIETSESYANGRNEVMIGDVIKDFNREQLFIATKAFPSLKIFKSANDVIQRAEDSIKRLQTDYIDLYMIHQAQNIFRVKDNYFHRAADILKKKGKIRFTGLSCHGPEWGPESRENLEDILMAAVDDGRFDVIMLPYNFLSPEIGERILKACKENDIGTMIMKSNPILSYEKYLLQVEEGRQVNKSDQKYFIELEEAFNEADSFLKQYNMNDMEQIKDGAIQFILTNSNVNTICCRFNNFSDVNKYVRLSGTTLSSRNEIALNEFKTKLGILNCRIGCNICEKNCPHNVPVNRILRYNYYFHAHGLEKRAIQKYLELAGGKPDACMECDGYCEKACPYGVLTRPLLAQAHKSLNINSLKIS